MAEIVSANVGGAVAGGAVIPQPVAAGYATWPDIVKKETADVFAILNDRIARGGEDPGGITQSGSGGPANNPARKVATASLLSLPVIILIVAIVVFVRS
jgi:hypothetical protein